MADRISTLPDAVLCHILSFLPTKLAVATSVLSKRWKPLWLSVPTLDFYDLSYAQDQETYSRFEKSVYAVMLSRDPHQSIQKFRLECRSPLCDPSTVNIWVNTALQRGIENLKLSVPSRWVVDKTINLPCGILSCRTLVVLKLEGLTVNAVSSVDFPSLKTLHLRCVSFLEPRYLAELLCGCPVLEDLKTKYLEITDSLSEGEFKRLPKLVRANIHRLAIPLEVVCNVKFLRLNEMDWVDEDDEDEEMNPYYEDDIPVFHNLTNIELTCNDYPDYEEVVEVLQHCPKLQILVITKKNDEFFPENERGEDWPYPRSVPKCISLHLRTCRITNYKGSKGEFRFARYIMRNAKNLRIMTICTSAVANRLEKLKMIKKLSSCTRRSATCKLSFK